jgi:hypothetical protein
LCANRFLGQTVMVLTVDHGDKAMQIVNEQRKILNTAKEDAERLGSRDQMTITDQSGKEVNFFFLFFLIEKKNQ